MSHFSVIKCSIKNLNKNTLIQALKLMGFTDIRENEKVRDYYGRTELCDIVIPTQKGGVGIKITKGGIDIVTDKFFADNKQIANQITENVQQYYTTAAFQNSLQKLGYKVSVEKKAEKILVHAF
jgi:hypothetical protein